MVLDDYPRIIGEIEKRVKQTKFLCLYPACKRYAIKSHSQQRRRQLGSIAVNGSVYALNRNAYHYAKLNANQPVPMYKRIGVAEASIFQGFCEHHDGLLFSDVERRDLEVNNQRQAALFYLRAISYETAIKRKSGLKMDLFLSRVAERLEPSSLGFVKAHLAGIELFLTRDAPRYLRAAFEAIESPLNSGLKSIWKMISHNLLVSCCSCINPMLDQYTENPPYIGPDHCQPNCSFNLIPGEKQTHVIISWLEDHNGLCDWMTRVADSPIQLEWLLNLYAISESEDLCISPILWEQLSERDRQLCGLAARRGLLDSPYKPYPRIIDSK